MARDGEAKVYKPFRELHNRMLLWHGSRTTNYAGILSQGLRIAPPEAPVVSFTHCPFYCPHSSVIFVNENENGEKWENNEFVNEN